MTTSAQDAELLARVVDGDHQAFDQIMRLHENRVFSICLRILGDREGALDATQETFLAAFRKADQYQGRSAVGTWICRIAINTCYDQLRRAKRRPTEPLPEHLDPEDHGAADRITAAGLRPEIERALASLPPDFRSAAILCDVEGIPLAEAAAVLDVPVGTVKSRVFRARRLLAAHLRNLEGA